jgi:S-adenosylmethionine:tRNA ribosyltransferase-isomerase
MDPAALDYALDPALIAQHPLQSRDGGRLLVLQRGRGVRAHAGVREIGSWLRPGDLLVANDAEVIPARLVGHRASGGRVEVLLTEPVDHEAGAQRWLCLATKRARLHVGERLIFDEDLTGIWEGAAEPPFGCLRLETDSDATSVLRDHGHVPLPPYIERPHGPCAEDLERYQTIFARVPGAIAAPTAGLHFTETLLGELAARGIAHVTLTLLVGPGTFLPVRTNSLDGHSVPPERFAISDETAAAIADTRARAGRVVAIGTTTVRALESAVGEDGTVRAGAGRTGLVIAPGHCFRAVDALVTNLHLPRSSLLALVAAFAGTEPTLAAYGAATQAGYRFYSYGDAMLIQ